MRRKEKEITDKGEIEEIIQSGQVCRVGFSGDDVPYVVPMYYGYHDGCLFFHAALKGKKIDMLKQNNRVCFEIDVVSEIINTGVPCNWKNSYASVIGFGQASLVEDYDEKVKGLNVLVDHYAPGTNYEFAVKNVKRTAVIKIDISEMTGEEISMIFTHLDVRNHDVNKVAELIYDTEPGLFSLFFGKNRDVAYDRIMKVVCVGGNSFGFEHVYLAMDNEDILGLIIGYRGDDVDKKVESDRLSDALDFLGLMRLNLYDKLVNSRLLSTGFERDELYISNVSVGCSFRGRGVGTFLVENVVDIAQKNGCNRVILDVSSDNKSAIGLYKKLGFEVERVKKSWFWGFTIFKMVKIV